MLHERFLEGQSNQGQFGQSAVTKQTTVRLSGQQVTDGPLSSSRGMENGI